jgi:gamma-glutamyltranspeptidase/glutathione hydrolase
MNSSVRLVASVLSLMSSCAIAADAALGKSWPWPEEEQARYFALQSRMGYPRTGVTTAKAMIAGVTDPVAVHAGLNVLKEGGNAVDAALTAALAQVALNAGAAVSYAGILSAVYYDAATGQVYALNAAYNTVQQEDVPKTIPAMGSHSGRTTLVPGFMAGVEALHRRFGKRPFASLFEPAIWVADHGMPVSPMLDTWLKSQRRVVTRLPEGKKLFTKADGTLHTRGDTFRQPELAHTLRKVATEGAAYMYTGEWARKCAALVQREGGKMTVADLAAYQARWDEPARITFRDYEVVAIGAPNFGGALSLGALKVAEVGNIKRFGRTSESADALYHQIKIARAVSHVTYQKTNPAELLTLETARRLWTEIEKGASDARPKADPSTNHSSGVVVVDESGNMLSLLHSINTVLWGATGIFIDGVSIPDSASFQQAKIAEAGPGNRLAESTNPLLVLRNAKPVLASMAIGSGLHASMLHNVLNVLEFGLDPQSSADQPSPRGPPLSRIQKGEAAPDYAKEVVGRGDFTPDVIEGVRAKGQAIELATGGAQLGYWIGIHVDPESGKLRGGVSRQLNGLVEGY